MENRAQEALNKGRAGSPGDGALSEQDLIVTEDGEIIPRRVPPGTQGQVIFEEPSLG